MILNDLDVTCALVLIKYSLNILCHTMACFCVISNIQIAIGITFVVHYVLWILPPLCALRLCSMTHYYITMSNDVARDAQCNNTMGNDVARDIHCDVTMSNDIMCTSQCIIMLLRTSSVTYYYTYLCYCCFISKFFTIVHINH